MMKTDVRVLEDLEALERDCDPLNPAGIRACVERIEKQLVPHIRSGEGLVAEHEGLRVGLEDVREGLARVESDVSASIDLSAACRWLATSLRDHLRREAEYRSRGSVNRTARD